MQRERAPSAASRKKRTERTATWLEKHGIMPAIPHNWVEKEVTLQQLVDLGMLSHAEAAEEVGAGDAGGDDADATAAPAPDLTGKVLLYKQFSQAKDVNTEDWRKLGERAVKISLERPKPPALFYMEPSVERGEIGQVLRKRPRAWSKHEEFVFEVQMLTYRTAFDFCTNLPLTLET